MSVQAFNDFIQSITTAPKGKSAKKSNPAVAGIVAGYDRSLSGEAKGMAVMDKLVEAARSQGFDVTFDDVKQYVREMKAKYESDPMYTSMMDAYCNTTCHLGSVVGKK
ncbi:hypothetical protein [Okeania sp. KiyG1]|uniref:hypothetical protein n=1 Tax=Okeania sp. KiyG1 TaxID=2720165 RepID=UPI001920C855|nr:hypothetical protein [Okeania sp. KiyG1]GGA11514.1 hypothetical protein CYANOKiyG1_24450 [Okeania sp. KiyG1]GGA18542.1 hypothetical protein CYANOKiyG1_33040 [Okeania sp. KiyG1]